MQSRRNFLVQAGVAGLVAALAACSRNNSGSVRIGGVLPLTGDGAMFGNAASRGASLAIKLFNQSAGNDRFRWVVQDSQGEPVAAASATRKLIEIDNVVALIGDVTSAATHAIVPIATAARRPLISPAASDPALSGSSPFFARVWPSDLFEAGVIAEYAKKTGYRRIAALYTNDDYGTGFFRAFRQAIGPDAIGLDLAFPTTLSDFRPIVQRIKAAGADSILLVSLPERARLFLTQAAEADLSLPILATGSIEDPQIARLGNAASITFASPAPVSTDSLMRKRFQNAYRSTYGDMPGVLADTGFDCAWLLASAYTADPDPARMMVWIKQQHDFDGASGLLSFRPTGDVVKPYRLKRGQAGAFAFV